MFVGAVDGGATQMLCPTCKSQFASIHGLSALKVASVMLFLLSISEQKSPLATVYVFPHAAGEPATQ